MPPTKHKTGDIFFSYLYDGLFNLAGIMTGQSILLLGMHTEAIHNPYVQDRFLSLKSADYIFQAAKSVKDEISFQPNGKIVRRARQVLEESLKLLKKIKIHGLMRAIEEGAFANVKRSVTGGKGLDGVIEKHRDYYTPLVKYLTPRSASDEERFPTRPARPVRGRIGGSSSRGRDGRERGRGSRRPSEIPTVADRETSSLQSNRPSFGEEENLEVEQESITSSVPENQPDREEDQGNRGRGRGRGRGGSGGRGGRPRSGPANRGGGGRGGRSSYPRRPLPTQAAAPSSTTPDAPPILLPERMPQPADEAPAAPSENKAGGSDSEGE
jgi:hypothetical protein